MVLNLSFKTRASDFLNLFLFIITGGSNGFYLILRDLRILKNY